MKRKKGKPHSVIELTEKFRKVFLDYGFEEIINPSIIQEKDVYRQYGAEAPLILNRSFYLAGLPIPELGISKKTIGEIKKIADIDVKELQKIFREFKKGTIEADNLIEEMVKKLKIKAEKATEILTLFPKLKKLKPIPTKSVLRSHMTAAWFLTINSLIKKNILPLKLFSIGSKFRREQQQDSLHLYESLSASLVVVDKKLDLNEGKILTKKILSKMGFPKVIFETKTATSNYYAPETEFEVFVKQKDKNIEVGDGGLYSPISLSNYNIPYPVFNVGFGVERLAMLKKNITDIRKLVYPQFYASSVFNDKEIASHIKLKKQPKTKIGKVLKKKIEKAILKYKDEIGPQKFLIYKDQDVKIFISEPETNKKLLGPAGLNTVYVYQGNILGINKNDKKFQKEVQKGIKVYSYIEAISNLFAWLAEKKSFGRHTIKIADTLPSINLELEKVMEKFITSKNKKIDVRGPIFVDMEIEKND
ncbi:O-phosphoserine--tRNA ligase [Candidatus Parcubacteria bacterium]|nr:O-phosphoserine--tRNA ligase [Candidatus Parcubacteria bacterium]